MKKIAITVVFAFVFNSAMAQEVPPLRAKGALIGPDGRNAISFGSFRAREHRDTISGPRGGGAYVGFAKTMTAPGSHLFGPANADVTTLFSVRKEHYLTSNIEGEVLTQFLVNEQGRKGDAATVLASTSKVKTGTSEDTGGALGYEFRAAFVDPSGSVLNAVHSYGPYMAPTTDMSGGGGYGSYVESFDGTNFAAFTAGAYLQSDASTGWKNAFLATADRTTGNAYFRVRGTAALERGQQPGDVVIGSSAPKTIRNNGGVLQIRNADDSATLLEISEAGALGLPSDPAWASYTPLITCGTGMIGKADTIGAFKGFGKTIHVRLQVRIDDLASCSGQISVSLPAAAKAAQVFAGSSFVSRKMLQGLAEANSTNLQILDYAGAFPIGSKDEIIVNGTFEAL
ncbi:hypothetical protein HT585_13025 [Ensifer sp. HO-A22]|uniref:Uncharacterized protein n=1 Tax=Ensifer oleiphilus TaxID=2742698 RepID=A0A7Y6Q683_9HYPH|nr:hypothetical protein [Ensifer oleiphilus]NVD39785.1 hypothetical protein [Ensifer oleiphilus]